MKRRDSKIVIAGVMFLLSLLLTLYPVISNLYNQHHQSIIHTAYEEVIREADTADLERIRKLAKAYNEAIVPGAAVESCSSWSRWFGIRMTTTPALPRPRMTRDPSGKLGWKSNTLTYGDTTAHVLEVLTGKASNAYKAFLRKLGISYIMAGENALDYELALTKLKELFGIETLMLGGGAALNWSFLQAGMCDEVSVVVAAAADGSPVTQTLFMAREGLSDDTPVGFALQKANVMDGGSVWLRYLVKHKEDEV